MGGGPPSSWGDFMAWLILAGAVGVFILTAIFIFS